MEELIETAGIYVAMILIIHEREVSHRRDRMTGKNGNATRRRHSSEPIYTIMLQKISIMIKHQ